MCMCVCVQSLSCLWLFATPWTVAGQARLSVGFPRQYYWTGLPFSLQEIFPTHRWNPDGTRLSCVCCIAGGFFTLEPLGNMLVTQLCPALCDPMHCSRQAPLSMEFSRQEYWSVLPFTSPGDLPHPGFEPRSTALQADSLPSQLPPGKPLLIILAHERVNERYIQVSYKNH